MNKILLLIAVIKSFQLRHNKSVYNLNLFLDYFYTIKTMNLIQLKQDILEPT